MSGNEVTSITYAIYILQLLLLPSQIISFLIRKVDKTRLRYLIFSISFVAFNSTWIFLGRYNLTTDILYESILQLNGVLLVSVVYFYVEKELGIFSGRKTLYRVSFASVILVFIHWMSSHFFNVNSHTLNNIFFIVALAASIYFASMSVFKLIKTKELNRNPILVAGIITLCQIAVSPIILYFSTEAYVKNLFINLCFLMISLAYFKQYITQLLVEYDKNKTISYFTKKNLLERYSENLDLYLNYGLSPRECEIAELLLQGMSYQDLSEKFSRTSDVMRKHGSNVFKKVGVSSLDEFRKKFE